MRVVFTSHILFFFSSRRRHTRSSTVSWARSIGLGAEASMTGDNDNDGINNLLEYALDSDPMNDSSHRLPSGATELIEVDGVTARYLTLTFRRNLAASELTFTVELADDLTGWNNNTAVPVSTTDHGDGTATEVWRAPLPLNNDSSQFVRLRVTN